MWNRVIALAIVAALGMRVTAASAQAHDPKKPGRILGVFDLDSFQPIEGADVIDVYVDAVARTPANGLIELSSFQSRHDSAVVRIRKLGFVDTAFVIMVGPADTVPVPVYLRRVAATLPTVIAEAIGSKASSPFGMMREFTDLANDQSTHPTVLSPAEMRKGDGRWLKDILFDKGVGASLRCKASGIRVYVDGVMQNDIGVPNGMTSTPYEAAIYYPINFAPPRYNMTSRKGCGVLLLWRRQNAVAP